FRHVGEASKRLMENAGTEPKSYQYCVLHQPNGKFPVRMAKKLGFTEEQFKTGLLTPIIGNTYSGSSMIGLCAVLDEAQPGDRIFVCAYGSGAGADAFDITVTPQTLKLKRQGTPSVWDLVNDKVYVDYAVYAKFRGKIQRGLAA
ncbi:MAG: hypothetical protein LC624_05845, partial [Halobacteriales archaeon]|nr:hypothetical protein [Halobacteriales archaeon]